MCLQDSENKKEFLIEISQKQISSLQINVNQKQNKHSSKINTLKFLALQSKAQKYNRKIKNMRQINQKYFKQIKAAQQKTKKNLPPIFQYRVPHSYAMIMQSYDHFFASAQTKQNKKGVRNKYKSQQSRLDAPPKLFFNDDRKLEQISFDNLIFEKESEQDVLFIRALEKRKNVIFCIKPAKVNPRDMMSIKGEHFIQIMGKTVIDGKDYLVVSQTINSSLRGLVKEFGNLDQLLIQKMVRQLVDSLKPIHWRKCKHGKISLDTVYHNGRGQILIDVSDIKVNSNNCNRIKQIKFDAEFVIKVNDCLKQRNIQQRRVFEDDQSLGMFINYYYPPEVLIQMQNEIPIWTQKSIAGSSYWGSEYERKLRNKKVQRQCKQDIWQIGVLCLELMFGTITKYNKMHPYNYKPEDYLSAGLKSDQKTLIELINCQFQQIDQSFQTSRHQDCVLKQPASADFVQLIKKCLTINADLRPNIQQVSKLSFLNRLA